ncbi:Rieske 2Fe-2S subunit signature [Acididesulfobacillus acetoxydans]|uniref:Rieske (2Fe-2S) iron-sulfur domain protein n=1 Tax=Acididesulfobacillus acetoxydans TaxID=1561005 RepID=A0A8S0W6Q6_9FIRM|nr:ubiquinol-cytochrome c reductase iron-sulfur subunit [Acididesulfobacillus acetoxydans]CAA7600069.1 Rieske 2Fe-2S subunit signature [Acididesulfobacillus acetoxydans]CEJ07844.1 Rieske (2Fe-2S) iron-sulfur domain protein [Acididesulfobacillus acetoxydans]
MEEIKRPAGVGKVFSRRRFLQVGVSGAGTVLGLSYIGLGLDFLQPPPLGAEPLQTVGKTADFPENMPKPVTYSGQGVKEGVYVVNLGQGNWLALDFHCTHLQCAVNWVAAVGKFMCPCHGGVYDIRGQVLSGPPPKALPRRVIKIIGDSVQVGGILA